MLRVFFVLLLLSSLFCPSMAFAAPADGSEKALISSVVGQELKPGDVAIFVRPASNLNSNYRVDRFGSVVAVAPATMTVLNADPSLLNVSYAELSILSPMQFLVDSLSPKQFAIFATVGLGITDLSPTQQSIFREALPDPFQIAPVSDRQSSAPSANVVVLSADQVISQVKLHGFLEQQYNPASPNGDFDIYSTHDSGGRSSGKMKLTGGEEFESNWSQGAARLAALLCSSESSHPKPSEVNWLDVKLRSKALVLDGESVANLAETLSKSTGLTLTVDSRYAALRVTVVGSARQEQPSGELMQALASSVTGAWRSTGGQGYLLTNDIAGLSTRRQFLRDIESKWRDRYFQVMLTETGKHLSDLKWMSALDNFPGDQNDLSRDQLLNIAGQDESSTADMSWIDLPPSVQASLITAIKSHMAMASNSKQALSDATVLGAITPQMDVRVETSIITALELPSTGIMSFKDVFVWKTPKPSDGMGRQNAKVSFSQKVRGLICVAQSAADVRQIIDLLPGLGLNTLFLDVFNNGQTCFPSKVFPLSNLDSDGVLAAAIDEGRKCNVSVYAVVDTLCWSKDGRELAPLGVAPDKNVFGEPSSVGMRRRMALGMVEGLTGVGQKIVDSAAGDDWVSPFDPVVQKSLPQMIAEIVATPGLSGLVFQDAAPPGYGGGSPFLGELTVNGAQLGLGYTAQNRALFFKKFGTDPIDIPGIPPLIRSGNAQWSAPPFDFAVSGFDDSGSAAKLSDWSDFLANGDRELMSKCFAAARSTDPKLPLFIREESAGVTIDPWIEPGQVGSHPTDDDPLQSLQPGAIVSVPAGLLLDSQLDSVPQDLGSALDEANSKGSGVAIDLQTGVENDDILALLQQMSQYIEPARQ